MTRAWAIMAIGACLLFALSWFTIQNGWFGRDQLKDTGVYQAYDAKIRAGQVPYRDFAVEYPPLALPVFVVAPPAYNDPSGQTFQRGFERVMEACGLALVLLTALSLARLNRLAGGVASLVLVGLTPLLSGSVILTRFDLWPAALVAAAVAALLWELDVLGAILLAIAIAAKLYPAALAPIGLVWVWQRHGRRAAAAWAATVVAVTAAAFLPFAILSPGGLGASLSGQLTRPLQVESLGSAVLIALHHVFGLHLHSATSHGSQNLTGSAAGAVGVASTVLLVLTLLAVWVAFASRPVTERRLVAAAATAIATLLAFGKVFSPQFLIWLVPLVPLVRGRRGAAASGLLVAAFVLTQSWFPHHYWPLALHLAQPQSWALLARDLVVVGLVALLAWPSLEHDLLGENRSRLEALQRVRGQVQ